MISTMRACSALLAATLLAGALQAQTILVTTSRDVVDVPSSTAKIGDLPGPDGVVSFREALLATDHTPGHQTIGFAIPQADWYLPTIFPGLVLLQGSFSWSAADTVTIDGTTQARLTGDTNPLGNEVVLYGLSLYVNGDGSRVTGLHDSRVEIGGSNCLVNGNTGLMNIFLFQGSRSLVRDNQADSIKLDRSHENVIIRNTVARVRIDGWYGGGQPARGNRIGGPDLSDRNFITGWGNYGEHGTPAGITVELFDTLDTLVENNSIGTAPDGLSIGSRAATVGVGLHGENRDVVVRGNLIAVRGVGVGPAAGGIFGRGILIQGLGSGIDVLGNTVGLDARGEPRLGCVVGVEVLSETYASIANVRIGGTGPGEGNEIAGHLSAGVQVGKAPLVPSQGIRICGNSIHDNGGLGIDLLPNAWTFGPTPNDPMDADTGANGLQNYPEIATATHVGTAIRVVGRLRSAPLNAYTVEVFASPDCDASGFGEGRVFLGAFPVTTDAAGAAAFVAHLPALAPKGWKLTSTATLEPMGATSEFSACTAIVGGRNVSGPLQGVNPLGGSR